MKQIKEASKMLSYNLKTLVCFELFFKILSFLLFTPLFVHLFDFILKVRGFDYITLENMLVFFLHPLTISLLIFLIFLIMIYTMFDIITIITILDCSYQKQKINMTEAIRIALEKCRRLFHIENIGLAIMVLFLIPFLNIGVGSSFISRITIPEFIEEYILKNKILVVLSIFVLVFLATLLLRWIYAIHYYVLEEVSFKEARKKSSILGYKKHIRDWEILLIVQLALFIFYILFIALGVFFILLFQHYLANLFLKSFLTTVIFGFIAVSFLIFTLLSTPISYAGISALYYMRKSKKKEIGKHIFIIESDENKKSNKILRQIFACITIISLFTGTIFTYKIYKGEYDINIEYKRNITLTAHRGDSKNYPENTFAAFIGAKELGADVIELDVQQTKDNEIIVMHDKNLKRTTGVDKYVWEMTKEEVLALDVGSYFDVSFKKEKIPFLKEVVKWAKENNMKLNIELKPTGKETDFESFVVNIIKDADYIENVVIASQVYQVLEKVKEIDANIKTVFVASLFYGNIEAFPSADYFSLEASNITNTLVNNIHKEGKEIYVWTINNDENMHKMIEFNVDNLITDNIELAKKAIITGKKSNMVWEYIKWVEKHFK